MPNEITLQRVRLELITVVLLAMLPAFVFVISCAYEQRQMQTAEETDDLTRIVQLASFDQDRLIVNAHQFLATLAQVPSVRSRQQPDCRTALKEFLAQSPQYANIGIAELDGRVSCSALDIPAGGASASDREYFQRTVQSKAFSIGEYQIGRISHRPSLNFGYPITDDQGRLQAVLFAGLDLAWLNQLLASAVLPQNSVLTVVDHHGKILARSEDSDKWVGRMATEAESVQNILLTKKEGSMEARGVDGVLRLYSFREFDSVPGDLAYVSAGMPKNLITDPIDKGLSQNLLTLEVITILEVMLVWLMSGRLVRPPS